MQKMLNATLTLLGKLAEQKKLIGTWLIILTAATGQIGEKVYVERTRELAVVETQLQQIMEQLKKMDTKLDTNGERLIAIALEQARVRAELEAHREMTGQQLEQLRLADAKLEAALLKHLLDGKKKP